MKAFEWDDRFKTGLDRVDDQHFHLVDLVNQVAEIAEDGDANEHDLQCIFNQLAEYANSHFAEEEQLMERVRLDPRHTLMHKAQHDDFIRQVTSMWQQRDIAETQISVLHGFLSAWLVAHILGVDHGMSRMVTDIQSGLTPDIAWHREAARHSDSNETILLNAMKQLYSVVAKQNRLLAEANNRLVETMKELEASAHLDTLTGLPNRALFQDRLRQTLARAKRHEQMVSLLFIDIDRFKPVNDQYGHAVGDGLLRAVVARLKSCSRQSDAIGRWGGDEFLMLLPEISSAESALHVAIKLQEAIAQTPLVIEGYLCDVSLSIGHAIFPDDAETPEELIALADQRMYLQKRVRPLHQR